MTTRSNREMHQSGSQTHSLSFWSSFLPPLWAIVGIMLTWQTIVWLFAIHPYILPAPSRILQAVWTERLVLFRAIVVTGAATCVALLTSVVLGTLSAIVFSQSLFIRRAFYPYVIFFQTVPIVAIAPLLILWSGYNFRTVILIAVIISLFPIVSNVTAGLISIDRNLLDLFRIHSASRVQLLVKLAIPAAVPHLVLGLRVSCGLALIGTILGELFVGNGGTYDGLGTIMTAWQLRGKTDSLMAAILVSTLMGMTLLGMINWFSRSVLRRWTFTTGFESNI